MEMTAAYYLTTKGDILSVNRAVAEQAKYIDVMVSNGKCRRIIRAEARALGGWTRLCDTREWKMLKFTHIAKP